MEIAQEVAEAIEKQVVVGEEEAMVIKVTVVVSEVLGTKTIKKANVVGGIVNNIIAKYI